MKTIFNKALKSTHRRIFALSMLKTRKTPQTWIAAGLKALPKFGVDGIRAETLARALSTTKGSFYWHFKDVPAFHAALLASWSESAEKRFRASFSEDDAPALRLRSLANYRLLAVDHAIRAWAVHDTYARKSVAKLDQKLLSEIESCLNALDATHPDFPGLVLASILNAPKGSTQTETLVDMLLMLK